MAPEQTSNPQSPVNVGATPAAPDDPYLRTKVLTARPEELRLMLLDGAIKFARQGRDGLANKDYEASYTGLSQSRDIVLELMTSIGPSVEPALADQIRSLYSFMYSELVSGSFERDIAKIDKVIELLGYERETWVLAMQQIQDAAQAPAASAEPESPPVPASSPIGPPPTDEPRSPLNLSA